ncbi:Abi family protein [Clostridium paraputrificum]|uniref:Abi family protein n=1 Tax=Clostridium paraputrificum TaxID=29363 RepID=UPI0011C84B07|nr:Abi family protein [Clostridium paraputrificum]MDB2123911.1 Abi family protein [Clostridium paraputrificum]
MGNTKTLNGLMKHLRDKHNINIGKSSQKQKLRNIGYYHGFKGYRYITNPNNKIQYTDFEEILSVNEFDMELKALLYPKIMFIETALKSHVLEIVTVKANSSSFAEIYEKLLTEYKNYKTGSSNYKSKMKKRLDLRSTIYKTLSFDYSKDTKVVSHFYENEKNVPIWAIFECINLGDFGNFISCLDGDCRREIEMLLSFNIANDSNYKLLERIVFALKDLRNSIAHNNIIFDTRFRKSNISGSVSSYLSNETGIVNITFNNIVDYIILVTYILKSLCVPKREINKFINEFDIILERFYSKVPNIYSSVLPTETKNKLLKLKNFL